MRTRSIRFQLTVWYAVALAVALALFGSLVWLSMRHRLLSELDEQLQGGALRFEAYFRQEATEESGPDLIVEMEEFCQGLGPAWFVQLHGDHGFDFRYGQLTPGRPVLRRIDHGFSMGPEKFRLEVGSFSNETQHTLDLLGVLLIGLIPLVTLLAGLGGAWLSRRALRPVDEITTAARTIGIENLSRRLPVPPTGDEIQRLAETWNGMLNRLESAVGTLSQFAADASHELRTPLAVIRTTAELALRRAREPESYRESLLEVVVEAERMTWMVEDLLFLARNDSKAVSMPMESVSIELLVREVVAELRELAGARGIDVSVFVEHPLNVLGNRPALRRLLLVLLDNAQKYSHPGGKVLVRVGADSVTVEDSGIGISEEDLPHIFRRFYRADKSRTNDGSGSGYGLGLSLAETIARMHGAEISASSVWGAGSVFRVGWGTEARQNNHISFTSSDWQARV